MDPNINTGDDLEDHHDGRQADDPAGALLPVTGVLLSERVFV